MRGCLSHPLGFMQTKSGMRVPHKDLPLLILSSLSWSATSMKTWHVPCNSLAGAHQYLYWCVYLYSAMPGACPEGVATPEGRFSSDYYITIDRAFAYLPSGLDGRNHLHSNNTAIHITFSGLLARNSGLVVLNT